MAAPPSDEAPSQAPHVPDPAPGAPASPGATPGPAPDLSALLDPERIDYIERHGLRSDPPSDTLDRITELVRHILGVPASTVTIVSDVQTTVTDNGLNLPADKVTVSIEESFCARAMATGEPFVVPDAASHPWVAHTEAARSGRVVGYLGAPIFSEDGHALGAVCAFSDEPHAWSEQEIAVMSELAALATGKLDLQVRNAWLREALDEVEVMALQDPLTGLANRRVLIHELDEALERGTATVIALDLDGFKRVNDRYGHAAADEVLKVVAQRLEDTAPHEAVVARMGGDELAVLVPWDEDAEAATSPQALAQRLVAAVIAPVDTGEEIVSVGVSVGVAGNGGSGDQPLLAGSSAGLLQAADAAMYTAKQAGGGVRRYDPSLHDAALRVDALEEGLRAAVHSGEGLGVAYQPLRDLRDGSLLGVEALLRFRHPRLGPVPTAEVLAVAEQRSLLRQLDAAVFDLVSEQRERWHAEGLALPRLWLNVSAAELSDPPTIARLVSLAERPGAPIGVDVSETGLFETRDQVVRGLRKLAEAGVAVAIDRFGAGHSSLGNLREVPVDVLKLDPSFLGELCQGGAARRIVEGVVALGRALGAWVVAEGVEQDEQLHQLRTVGCDAVTGHLLGGPLPEGPALRRLLADQGGHSTAPASAPSDG